MRSLCLAFAAALAAGALIGPVQAQTADPAQTAAPPASAAPAVRAQVRRDLNANVGALGQERTPRFIVQAIRFHANDETGSTNVGSDEILAVFSTAHYQLVTARYEDIDNGESRGFVMEQRCIYPAIDPDNTRNYAWGCRSEGAAGPLHFTITLREHDGEHSFGGIFAQCTGGALGPFPSDLIASLNRMPCEAQDAASSVIGRFTVVKSVAELVAAMPAPGRFLEEEVLLGGPCPPQPGLCNGASDGEYTVVHRITRTADLVQPRPATRR